MMPHTLPQTVLFPDLFDKPLVATFNQEHASSDGGAVLLKAAELGLIRFGGHLPRGEYDVDHDGHAGQADAAELHG